MCARTYYTHTHYFMSLIRLINGNFSPTNLGHNTKHICLTKKDTGRYSLQWGVGGVCGCVCVCLEKGEEEEIGREEGRWSTCITLRTYHLSVKYIHQIRSDQSLSHVGLFATP